MEDFTEDPSEFDRYPLLHSIVIVTLEWKASVFFLSLVCYNTESTNVIIQFQEVRFF